MKIFKLSILTGLLLMAACSSDDVARQDAGQPLLLTASPQEVGGKGEVTRAADNLYTAATGFDGTETAMVWFNGENAVFRVSAANGAAKKSTVYGGGLIYPNIDTGNLPVYALIPSESAASHTVAYDQTTDEAYKQSDLMFATGVVDMSVDHQVTPPEVTFTHQLVKLKVNITKDASVTAITQIKMLNVKRTVALTPAASGLSQGTLTTASGEGGDNILIYEGAIEDTNEHTYVCVFPAQAWVNNANFLVVTADGFDNLYQLTKNDWVNGNEYVLDLNINANSMGLSVALGDWTPDAPLVVAEKDQFVVADVPQQTYNGVDPVEPTPAVYYNGVLLTLGTDYILAYKNNEAAGTATVFVLGKGENYRGLTASKTFQIVAS